MVLPQGLLRHCERTLGALHPHLVAAALVRLDFAKEDELLAALAASLAVGALILMCLEIAVFYDLRAVLAWQQGYLRSRT